MQASLARPTSTGPSTAQRTLSPSMSAAATRAGRAGTVVPTRTPTGRIVTPSGTARPRSEATDDLFNCGDFPSQASAQLFLRRYPTDPSRLDPDDDGVACESNRAPRDTTPVARG
ncbi:MAG: excalibur calcium-binding domain-containing protein [Chloroflexota bacterium]|nr:MAG: excalibur calcium-binding domain-containing protein [Chloroflexota bacterium]